MLPDKMRIHPEMVSLVRDAFNKGKIVAAICHAGWMLASAGILKGKQATSYIAIKDDMVNAGALWEDSETVRDGNLITARKPDDLPSFCRTIIEAMEVWKGNKIVRRKTLLQKSFLLIPRLRKLLYGCGKFTSC